MGKSAKIASLRKGIFKKQDKDPRLGVDKVFKRKKRQRKPRIKDAIIARRLERPETLQSKSISSLFKSVQQNQTLSRGQKRRLASKVRYLRQKKLEEKAQGRSKQPKEGDDVIMEEAKIQERKSKNEEHRLREQVGFTVDKKIFLDSKRQWRMSSSQKNLFSRLLNT